MAMSAQLAWLGNRGADYLVAGVEPERLGNAHPSIVPYEAFAARDGRLCGLAGGFFRSRLFRGRFRSRLRLGFRLRLGRRRGDGGRRRRLLRLSRRGKRSRHEQHKDKLPASIDAHMPLAGERPGTH